MVVKIDYGELESSSKALNKAAKYCGDYASRLRRKVPNELDNLTRGSSSYTSSASYFASAKIQSLEKQQQKCLDVSGKIDTFIKDAKSTDQRVAGIMKKEGNEFRKANGLSFGWTDGLMQVISRFAIDAVNKSSLTRWIDTLIRDRSDAFNAWLLDKKHWYACEGGKYVWQRRFAAIVIVTAALAVIAAAFVLWPILIGTSTVALLSWGGAVAVCTLISSIIALGDAIINFQNKSRAIDIAKNDPGWAARYADINSISEYYRKTCFDSRFANIASNWAAIGIDAVSVICTLVSLGNLIRNGYKFFTNTYRANANWKRYFKMWDSNGKFNLKITIKNWKKNWEGLNFAFNHDFQYTQLEGARKRNYALYNFLEKMKDSHPYKIVMEVFDKLEEGVKRFERYAYSKPT